MLIFGMHGGEKGGGGQGHCCLLSLGIVLPNPGS